MKKLFLFITVIIPIFSFGQTTNKIFRKALKTTNSKEKVELFTKIIELEPKNFDAYFYRAIAKNDLGDYYGAITDYSKIIVYEPDADIYYNRGNSKYSIQDYDGAKEDYSEALKLDSAFTDALYNLACTKYLLDDFVGAILDLNSVINVAPNQSHIYIQRANAYLALKKYKVALKDFSMAVLIDPNANTYYNRGVTYLDIYYYKKANTDFSRAIRFNPSDVSSYFYRGTTFLLLGKYNKALSDFLTTLKYDALDYETLLGLALTYYKMDDLENAKSNFKKAKELLTTDDNIELFVDTFWYKKQYYFFKENLENLNKL
jgi:tetratricopeptide (TPR) repeat protein